MNTLSKWLIVAVSMFCLGLFAGCGQETEDTPIQKTNDAKDTKTDETCTDCEDGSHDHAATTVNGGVIVELGDSASHLEIAHHPDDKKVIVRLIPADSAAKLVVDEPIYFNIVSSEGPKKLETTAMEDGFSCYAVDPSFSNHSLVGQAVIKIKGKEYIIIFPEHCHEH